MIGFVGSVLLAAAPAAAGSFDFYSGAGPTLGGAVVPLSIIQSISAERSFMKEDPEEANPFLRKRRQQERKDKWATPPEPTTVSWNLGYTFSYSAIPESETTESRVDNVHSFSGGLGWDPLETFGAGLGLRVDTNPTENYRAGTITIGFGSAFYVDPPRKSSRKDPEEEEQDIAPHLRHVEGYLARGDISFGRPREAGEDVAVENPGPVLFARGTLLFGKHLKRPLRDVRTASGTVTLPSQEVRQYGIGLEGWFYPEPTTGFRANVTVYRYGAEIDGFLSAFRDLRESSVLAARAAGVGNFASILLGFPSFSADLGFQKTISDRWSCEAGVNFTSYESAQSRPTYGGSGTVSRRFGALWRVGVGADATFGNGFTSVIGSLQLSRAI